jgi:hypothetical protein
MKPTTSTTVCKPEHPHHHKHKHGHFWGWFKHWFKWHHGHHHDGHHHGHGHGHNHCKPDRDHDHDRDECKHDRDDRSARNGKWSSRHDCDNNHSRSIAARLVNFNSSGPATGGLALLAAALSLFFVFSAGERRRRLRR